jgi:hypothetical protein
MKPIQIQRGAGFSKCLDTVLDKSRTCSVGVAELSKLLSILAVLLASAAIALHSPGHVSMDSSLQLFEAHTGTSISWNPPFMSALMRWLGGGEVATAALVWINSILTYVSLAKIAGSSVSTNSAPEARLSFWKAIVFIAILLNPILFFYVGIIWKDVLFASLLTAAISLSFAAGANRGKRAIVLAVLAVVILSVSMDVRQQGMFMAPILAALPVLALARNQKTAGRRIVILVGLAGVFLMTQWLTDGAVDNAIDGAGRKSSSVGFRSIQNYDIAGVIALSRHPTSDLPIPMSETQRSAIRHVYSSQRVDYLSYSSEVSDWLNQLSDDGRKDVWRNLIAWDPGAYVRHRVAVFMTLLNASGNSRCLPVHVGVDGNPAYLDAVGLVAATDARDSLVYKMASNLFHWPIYRHWVYFISLFAGAFFLSVARVNPTLKAMGYVIAFATSLFYLSFLPTGIACDFRYLYAGIPLVSIVWMTALSSPMQLPEKQMPVNTVI